MSTAAARHRVAAELQNTANRLSRQHGIDTSRTWDDLPPAAQELTVAVLADLEARALIAIPETDAELAGADASPDRLAAQADQARRAAWHEDDQL